jgi:hypothetical protein
MAEQPQKEYGKLTAEQFKIMVSKLPEVRSQRHELTDLMKSRSKEKLDELLGNNFCWAIVYELPFIEHIAWLLAALDKVEFVKAAVLAADPQQAVLDNFDVDDGDWQGGVGGYFTKADLIGLVASLQRTILSIMIYQRSLSGLVEEVRQGNEDSLFDAVRLDRSIVACPTIAARISRAELLGEKRFFLRLRKALKGPSQKHWEAYQDLRYALYTLRELGFDKLSDEQLENLLVHQLKVYPNTFNAKRNLRKQYSESKKISTT